MQVVDGARGESAAAFPAVGEHVSVELVERDGAEFLERHVLERDLLAEEAPAVFQAGRAPAIWEQMPGVQLEYRLASTGEAERAELAFTFADLMRRLHDAAARGEEPQVAEPRPAPRERWSDEWVMRIMDAPGSDADGQPR